MYNLSLTYVPNRQQPWSTYALHIATFTSLSVAFDPLIIFLAIKATETWSPEQQKIVLGLQLSFMLFSKVIKLVGLFMREPADLIFLPVSIIFGYFHGFIKLYAGITLRMVSHFSSLCPDILIKLFRLLGVVAQMGMPMTATA